MSTQDETGIALSRVPEERQQHFRLLELPPELLSLLTSDNPPILELKSAETSAGSSSNANAVLCTPDKTYNIRQVSTSNDVYITQPSIRLNGEYGGLPRPAVETIAQCSSTTELQAGTNSSAAVYLRNLLPVYTSTGHHYPRDVRTKIEHFSNVPYSAAECEKAWRELACFDLDREQGGCFMPSAKLKVQVWKSMLTAGTANGLDWEAPLGNTERECICGDDEDWPVELSNAVLQAISDDTADSSTHIDSNVLVRFVGISLLEAQAPRGAVSKSELLHLWADALPERWRSKVEPSLLESSYIAADGGKSLLFVAGKLPSDDDANGTAPTDGKSSLATKRKWHNKFRQSNKAA